MNEIKLKGIKNIRDLGGLKVKDGTIKTGKLLRSPALDKLTKQDIDILVNDYHLSTIIDLRTDKEVEERRDLELPNVKNLHMPIFNDRFPGITHEKQEDYDRAFANFEVNLPKLYRGIVTDPYLEKVSGIIKTIINLPEEEYAVVFHCTAGKDRTGIIATILLLILGADKQTIIDDYMYTNKVSKWRALKTYWLVRILEHNKQKAKNMKNIFVAKIEYISQVFEVIEKDWNGVDNFLKNGLKITQEEIDDFRRKVLEN